MRLSIIKSSKALFTQDILTHNIAIKRYCDKNIFLSHRYIKAKVSSLQKINQGKYTNQTIQGMFFKA